MAGHLTVELHALWTGGSRGYRYNVNLNGECIVGRSHDPETDLARALLARGLKGTVTVLDGKTGKPRTRVNIVKAAKVYVAEEDRDGLRYRKHVEHPDSRAPAGESLTAGSRIPNTSFNAVSGARFPQEAA